VGSLELSCRRRAKENVLYLLSLDARQKHPASIRSLSMLPFFNEVPINIITIDHMFEEGLSLVSS
jgi:hypothetical protein